MNYTESIELAPDSTVIYYDWGLGYQNLREFEQAIQDFERYLSFTPDAQNRDDVIKLIDDLQAELTR